VFIKRRRACDAAMSVDSRKEIEAAFRPNFVFWTCGPIHIC
jgi:hypothetical protein